MLKFNYKKGLLLISLLLIICFSVSAVSAMDTANNDISNDISVSVVDINVSKEVSTVQADANIGDSEVSNNIGYNQKNSSNEITKLSAGNTFATIQSKVDAAKAGSTIKLSGTYTGSGKAININKALTIDGCGATLDANGLSQIFYITGKGCTIKNIIFKNACSKYGGAIYWNGTSGTLTNCTFINCSSKDYGDGGSVYWAGSNGKLTNCKFIDSHGADNGGAVYWTGSNGILSASTFNSSSSSTSAGAISWSGINGKVYGCTFISSSCSLGSGGSIYWGASNGTLYNCTFLDSYSRISSGSIYWAGENANIYNSIFINSTTSGGLYEIHGSGGAIYLTNANGKITNCTFTSCSATTNWGTGRGGAIALYDNANKTTITNCDFTDCYSIEGGAIYGTSSNVKITSSEFDKCSASNSAGAIYLLGSNNNIDDCDFAKCTSNSVAGAIAYASSNSILNNSHFEDCSAVYGGAVYCAGSSIYLDCSEFINCKVNGSPMAVSGSVSWAGDNGKLTNSKFINSTAGASSNDATVYGGSVSWYGNNGKLAGCTFTNSKIVGSDSVDSYGGAVAWMGTNGDLTDCKFTNSSNKASADNSYGGAIYWNDTKFIINNSSFLDSFAKYGHAIYAENTTIYNSTFYVNDEEGETEEDMVYNTSVPLLKSQNDKFLYSKYISILTAENMVKDVTNKTSFTVKLTDRKGNPIIGNVTFTLNGETYNVLTNPEGVCRLNITSQIPAGVYSINVFFEGKDPYYPSDNISAILTVNKLDADMMVYAQDTYYGHEINFTALVGVVGIDANGTVSFYVDGVEVGSSNVIDGKATYTYYPTKTGTLTVKAVYNGSDIYNSGSAEVDFTVSKLDTSISVVAENSTTYKSPVNLIAHVTADVTVTDGQVSFYVDDVKVGSATVKNGVATCTYTPTKTGTLTIKAFYNNSTLFKDSDSTNTFYVAKAIATVSVSQNGSYYKATKLNVKLVSADGTPLGGEKVSINIGGKTVNVTTNANGIATYNVPLAPGTYSASIKSVSSNVIFNAVTKKVTIKKVTGVVIAPTALTTTYNSGKYFQVKVYKGSYLFVGVKLKLKVYTGKKYKTVTVTTGSNGIAKYSASKLALGKHKIVVSSAESTKYMTAKSKTSYVTIKKAPTTVSAPKVTNKYKKSAYFKVTVKNKATGKVVSGLKLKIKVYTGKKYKTYTVKTNSKGVASLNTKGLSKGTHKVVIKSGNKYYTVSKSGKLIVIK